MLVAALFAAAPAFAGVRFTPATAPPDALVISSAAASDYLGSLASIYDYGVFAVPGRGIFQLFGTQYVPAPCADAQIADVVGYYRFSAWTSCGLFDVRFGTSEFVAIPVTGLPAGAQVTALADGLVGTSNAGVYS
ncbi:MAG TPA: hypothetical protein VHM71_07150, partial [Candidatus Deferrimicrobium sp.]|nr:hypothetical protein [Candidatus Deferrimicrobium sp.]